MSTNFPTPDQTFALSMFAGSVQNVTGPDLAPLASTQITEALANAAADPESDVGTWKIVWGPVVMSQPFGPADSVNLMYVVQNSEQLSQYVVAIAGTNFGAVLDSVVEDCFVSLQVPWIYDADALRKGARIALGTAIGLFNLQNLTPDARLPGAGQKLSGFLAGLDLLSGVLGQKVQITVAGHSLGGALASVVALWLADTQGLWDPGANATIAAHTFAGPTAGNSAFAEHAGAKLGADRLVPYYNTLDAVPHAWREGTDPPTKGDPPSLSELDGLYVADIPPDASAAAVVLLVAVLRALARRGDYQTLPNLRSIAGTFDTTTDSGAKQDAFDRYLAQVGYQHIGGYYGQFNYNPKWRPALPLKPVVLSTWFAETLRTAGSADAVVQALQSRQPQKISVGGTDVEVPWDPNDPQAARVVELVQAALAQQAKGSPAA